MSRVSVIIPVHNSATFIGAAVKSVLSQTCPPDQVIVVDDGSSDSPELALTPYMKHLVIIRQPNQGPSTARNQGIRYATGKYVAFLDADDRWPPMFLEEQLEILATHPEAGLVFGDMQIFQDDNMVMPSLFQHRKFDEAYFGPNPLVERGFEKLLEVNFIPTGTVVVPSAVLEKVGGFPQHIRSAEDRHLWIRIAGQYPILWNSNVCLYRNIHDRNITKDKELSVKSWLLVVRDLIEHHSELFKKADIDPSGVLSDAEYSLGYYYFSRNESYRARPHFWNSLKAQANLKKAVYWLASILHPRTLALLRRFKQKVEFGS